MFEGNENSESTLKTGQAFPKNGNNQASEASQVVEKKNVFRTLTKSPLAIGALIILVALARPQGLASLIGVRVRAPAGADDAAAA